MFSTALPSNKLPIYNRAFARRGPHRKHIFPSIIASIRVYEAVAWQRVDQIRHNILTHNLIIIIEIKNEV
jgi:hypothetical protein